MMTDPRQALFAHLSSESARVARAPHDLSVVLFAAHPDDETVGAGAHLRRLPGLSLVHVTDGSPRNLQDARAAGYPTREAYAAARLAELLAALDVAGISAQRAHALNVIDQEASFEMTRLTLAVADLLDQLRPNVTMTHAYEGGHPDHDAVALAVHAACRLLEHRKRPAPGLVEMTSYHARRGALVTGEFLFNIDDHTLTLELDPDKQVLKQRLLACYRTQRETLAPFALGCERFRFAPRYDFTQPPHPGRLYYEHFNWGITGRQWRDQAREALAQLRLRGRI